MIIFTISITDLNEKVTDTNVFTEESKAIDFLILQKHFREDRLGKDMTEFKVFSSEDEQQQHGYNIFIGDQLTKDNLLYSTDVHECDE